MTVGLWIIPVLWVAFSLLLAGLWTLVCYAARWWTLTEGEDRSEARGRGAAIREAVVPTFTGGTPLSPSVSVPFLEVHEAPGARIIVFGEAWAGGMRVDRVDVETRT